MSRPLSRKPILGHEALAALAGARQQLFDAASGNVPEPLARATLAVAVRLARREAAPADVLSAPVLQLVRHGLKALAQGQWKPATALLLLKHNKEGGHG
jgi:hypothetical protein